MTDFVCPDCKGKLTRSSAHGLMCSSCESYFPKRTEVDVLLSERELPDVLDHQRKMDDKTRKYIAARRDAFLTLMYYDWWVSQILEKLPIEFCGPILELMCGGAEICRRLPVRFSKAIALDLNIALVEMAAQDLKKSGENRVSFVCGTAERLPLADQCMQAVVIQGGLHHGRPILKKILSEISRVLRPGGVLICSEPANDCWLTRMIRYLLYDISHGLGHDDDEDGFTRKEIEGFLFEHGLHLDLYWQFGFLAYPLMGNTDLLPLLSRSQSTGLGRMLLSIDGFLEKIPIIRRVAWASIFRAIKEEAA